MSQFIIVVIVVFICFHLFKWLIKWAYSPDTSALKLEQANQQIGQLQKEVETGAALYREVSASAAELREQFEKLRFNKISGDVKLGQKAEHLLPFLEGFPYKDDEIKGLFQPVDLIVFRQDEVVFVEIKTGTSSLTEKERRIRDNIKAGRVRFEVHRLNEKGITVK